MSKDNKTITLRELPELNKISDNDIFLITDGNKTHKITGKSLIQYMKSHDDIADYFVHQDTVGSANGVAALDGNKKILSENIPFGSQAGAVYEGDSGKALEIAVRTKADKTELDSHVTNQTSHITSAERSSWNDSNAKKHTHSNKTALDGITAPLITGWNNAAAHISDSAKHIAGNERALWNTVNDKVSKVDGKALSSNDFSNAEKAKLQGIESGANLYQHPDADGSRHIPANGTTNGGKYLKATSTAGSYKWENLTKADVESALGYTPSGSESVTYALSKSGSNIILTGSDGSKTSIPDSDTTYTLSDFGITSSSSEINQLKGVKSNVQTQLNNVYTKNEANTLLNDKLAKAGDGSNLTAAFTEAPALTTINTGEKLSVIMGKVKKAITALLSHTDTAATASVSGHVKVDSALNSASTNPVQNKAINTALAGKLSASGNSGNTTVAYTEAATLTELTSGEKLSAAFGKLKPAVKNVISFAQLLGSTDISAIGGGTVTGAISSLNSNLSNNFNWSTYSHVRQLGLDVTCTTDQIIDKLAAKGAGSMIIMAAFRPTDYPNIRWANTEGQHMYTVKCFMHGYVSIIDEDINNGILHYCTHYGDNYSSWDNNVIGGFIISPATVTTDVDGLAYINLPGMVMAVCTSTYDTTLELIKNQYGMYYVHVKKYSDGTNYVGTFDFWVLHSLV